MNPRTPGGGVAGRFEVGPSPNPEDRYCIIDETKQNLANLGITEPTRPIYSQDHLTIYRDIQPGQYFDGRMPVVVKNFSLDELSALYGLLRSWYEYITYQAAFQRTRKNEAEKRREAINVRLRKQAENRGIKSDQKIRDEAKIDEGYIQEDAKFEMASTMVEVLEAQLRITAGNIQRVSREISIRDQKLRGKMYSQGYEGRASRFARREGRMEEADGASQPYEEPAVPAAAVAPPRAASAKAAPPEEAQATEAVSDWRAAPRKSGRSR